MGIMILYFSVLKQIVGLRFSGQGSRTCCTCGTCIHLPLLARVPHTLQLWLLDRCEVEIMAIEISIGTSRVVHGRKGCPRNFSR